MRKKKQSAVEVPTGYPSIDPSMVWLSGTPPTPSASSAPEAFPGSVPPPASPASEAFPGSIPLTPPASGASAAAPPFPGPPSFPPLDDPPPDLDDDESGLSAWQVLVIIVAILVATAVIIVGTNVYTVTTTRDDVHRVSAFYQQDADAIVVLGASVFEDGTPSDILADRLEVAADLYKAGAAHEIIVSGDNADEHYNESDAMRDYLVDLGVPADKIVVDHLGTDTYSSIYRAKYAYGANRIVVVTQAYHLYRALMVAEGLGMQAGGVAADKGDYEDQTEYSVREILARTKDCLMMLLHVPVSTATSHTD